ncbi:hypothetical protein [Herbaspirillum huttiense]|uniref:hypothetical protein n=1 Tax=Herbaspirillum huttiense TaxID=863372 RepID=UPI0031DAE0E3
MTVEQDFLPYAVGSGANVLSQNDYAALTSLLQNGLQSGIVPSNQLNKILRQSSIMAAVLAQFIVATSGQPAIDDGTTATLLSNLTAGIRSQLSGKIQSISASVTANALTVNYVGGLLDFRSSTLASGAPISAVNVPAGSITIPSGATLGMVSGQGSRLVFLEAYNAGSPVLCVANMAGGLQLDETNLISPTTISSGANSSGVIYSASAVSANSPYRVVGFLDISEATAGTWATAPTLVQGTGGLALSALSGIGYGQTWQHPTRVAGTTYYNTTGRPILVGATCTSSGGGNAQFNVGGVATASVNGSASATGQGFGTWTVVPPGFSYSLALGGSATLTDWAELR